MAHPVAMVLVLTVFKTLHAQTAGGVGLAVPGGGGGGIKKKHP